MKLRLKITLVGILFICAVFSAAFSTVRYVKAEKSGEIAECMTESESDSESYILKEYEGHVAVYMGNEPNKPVTVTGIQVSTLREMDRKLLQTGIKIASHDRLMMTIEDLGS